jgi:hypothetical protein
MKGIRLRYAYFSAGIYLLCALLFTLGYLKGMGHGPNPFGFLFKIVFSACHLLDLLPDLFPTLSEPVRFMFCVLGGLILYGLIGFFIDVVLGRLGRRGVPIR